MCRWSRCIRSSKLINMFCTGATCESISVAIDFSVSLAVMLKGIVGVLQEYF
jgi:hypothetical protein